MLFAAVFSTLVLFGQDAKPRPRWTLKTKTGTKILVFVPKGTNHMSDSLRELLSVVKSLAIVRDDAAELLNDRSPLQGSFERRRIAEIHKELDALCTKHGYVCTEVVAPGKKLSERTVLVAIQYAAVRAINFTVDAKKISVDHPKKEVAEMHQWILSMRDVREK